MNRINFEETPTTDAAVDTSARPARRTLDRVGAAGKSLLVYLFSGSLGLALLAFILFKLIGW